MENNDIENKDIETLKEENLKLIKHNEELIKQNIELIQHNKNIYLFLNQTSDSDLSEEHDEIIETERAPRPNNHILDNIEQNNHSLIDHDLIEDYQNNHQNNHQNGWTEENCKTVRKWQSDIEKISFVYSEILSKFIIYLRVALILSLIISVISTILSALTITLSFLEIKWIPIAFNIVIFISAGCVTVLTGIIKIYGWENNITALTKFVEKLDNTWFVIETELSISSDQRQNAIDFIKRYDGEYMHLMRICPVITEAQYIRASHIYKERILNDHIWSMRFNRRLKQNQNNNQNN